MNLRDYIKSISMEQRDELAAACETTRGHLQNVMYGLRPCSPQIAVCIERLSEGKVTRQELCPTDFWRIWPDLAHLEPKGAAA